MEPEILAHMVAQALADAVEERDLAVYDRIAEVG